MLNFLENLLINFIWKNKRYEVSKDTLYRDIKEGGLNMINIREFEKALKLTWIRKLINGSPDWSEFAYASKIDKVYQTDIIYHKIILESTENDFRRSIIRSYTYFYNKLKKVTRTDPTMTLLWGNPNISIAFNNQLFNANIRYLEDLYIKQTRCTHKDIELKLNRKIPFLLYMAIWKKHSKQFIRIHGQYDT